VPLETDRAGIRALIIGLPIAWLLHIKPSHSDLRRWKWRARTVYPCRRRCRPRL